jgi:phage FluMu gp28-like protein
VGCGETRIRGGPRSGARAANRFATGDFELHAAVGEIDRDRGEFVRKAEGFVRQLGMRICGDGDNEISIAFDNGSRIVGLPGSEDTVRGFSAVNLLLVDEAARVSDELYVAVRPMLAVSGGTMWLMSTPRGKRGFFYETWHSAGAEWERVQVTAEECPRIPLSFLEEERRTMGEQAYQQEYGCAFSDTVTALFDRDLLDRAITREFAPLRID